ncbi:nuclear transport factor 2 family protein [Nocardia sp. NBC_01499]|uniref:nuclear transport factor 2 family protein n=1 Tax=Nocardia sp. NBC_01499 TaxID=2903597 RepID=UPI00386B2861
MRPLSENDSELAKVLTLVTHERQARDRGWWSILTRCYTPEATIQTSWFDGTAVEYIEVSKRVFDHTPSNHRLGQPVIDVNGTRAIVEVPITIEMRDTFRGVEVDLTSYLRMLHRAEKGNSGWRFAASVAIFDHDTMTPALPTAPPTLHPEDLEGARPSYRMLRLWMTERGYTVPTDRYGIDRPAELTTLYDAAYDWAGLAR